MSDTLFQKVKVLVEDTNSEEGEVLDSEEMLSHEDTKQLEFLIKQGQWEVLGKNRAFCLFSREGRIQAVIQAIKNRIKILQKKLSDLGRYERTRVSYIKLLSRIRELDDIIEQILDTYYAGYGTSQIDSHIQKGRYEFDE